MSVNENIFRILKDRKMSQKELSLLSGISESTISDWKRKGKTPGTDNLLTISKTLGISLDELLTGQESNSELQPLPFDYALSDEERQLIEIYRNYDDSQRRRIMQYLKSMLHPSLSKVEAVTENDDKSVRVAKLKKIDDSSDKQTELFSADSMLIQQKALARRLRKLARLGRLSIDESEHASKINLHLFKYLDYVGLDKLEYVKRYLSNIQPFMISEFGSQAKFENAVCVLDEFYRISVYIKVDTTKGEEIVVSFHENNKDGIAHRNYMNPNLSYVYVFADSVGSHISGTDDYSVNLFITRGVSTFPINVPARRYDEEGFLVRYTYINNAIVDIANRYLEELYSSDIDFSQIELFTSLHQLSFSSYGKDIFSNISIMIDSLFIQSDSVSRQIADSALCIYCSTLDLLESDKKELIATLKERYKVNSIKALPQILERVELNLSR